MKCKKCGAEIPKGKLYCSVCGAEVQLVPDYNFLEDDMLSDIIQNGAGKNITSSKHNSASQTTDPISSKKKAPAKKKKVYIISGICLVLVIAVLTAFFVYQDIQKKHQNSYSYQYEQGIKYQSAKDYDAAMLDKFDALAEPYGFDWSLRDILPKVLVAGENAGTLTAEGARILDTDGELEAGIPVCPPEGDAGTGMAATNSVAVRTGNVSAGTSVFAMIVLEKALKNVHTEIDLVTTPSGEAVAMAHCNNCTSDLNAWVNLFEEFANSFGMKIDKNELFSVLYNKALEGDADCGGLLAYNYFSGEGITAFDEGRPLFARTPDAKFNLANFMRVHLFTALGALKDGLDILLKEEGVQIDKMYGHGGLFKTPVVGQRIMAAAIDTPVSVMETAGEGGAWGIALLAAYMAQKEEGESLADYLSKRVFGGQEGVTEDPVPADVEGFDRFLKRYNEGLAIERAAVEHL